MATHPSILAWRIPWTEGPSGLSPWGRKESDTTEVTQHTQGSRAGMRHDPSKLGSNLRTLAGHALLPLGNKVWFV